MVLNHLCSIFSTVQKLQRRIWCAGLVKLSTAQIRQVFGHKHRVAIVSPTNVGKSRSGNQLVQNKRDFTRVGPLQGITYLLDTLKSLGKRKPFKNDFNRASPTLWKTYLWPKAEQN